MKPLLFRIILTWLLFLPVPIINGTLREKWYKNKIGERAAHQLGVAVLCPIYLLYAYVSLHDKISLLATGELWGIGAIWLLLTLCFEFGIGIAGGRTWEYMLADYKIWKGRIWPIVPAVVLVSPLVVKWIAEL